MKKLCARNRAALDYVDVGVGSIQDSYSPKKIPEIADYYMAVRGGKLRVMNALRDRIVFLLNHTMMLRGKILRLIDLKNIFLLDFPNEGASPCPAFIMMITFGKTNPNEEKRYSSSVRHKDVHLCGFGTLGLFLFKLKVNRFPTSVETKTGSKQSYLEDKNLQLE
jgi:hypothetical protein